MTEIDNEHVYIDQMVGPVAASAGVPKTVARKVIRSFCQQLNQELAQGHDVTIRDIGRFKVSSIKSYWKPNLSGERVAQKKYQRIYFTASDTIMRKLNKHLRG